MRRLLLSLTAAALVAPFAWADPPAGSNVMVIVNLTIASVPESLAPTAPAPGACRYKVLTAPEYAKLRAELTVARQAGRVKTLSEPELMTLSGQRARVRVGQDVPVPTLNGTERRMDSRFVGTELECLPIAMDDGRIGLELNLRVFALNHSRGVTTAFGPVPGFDEQSLRFAAEVAEGQTFAMGLPLAGPDSTVTLVLATPTIVRSALPAPQPVAVARRSAQEERLAKKAAGLVAKYHAACQAGDAEKARKLARQALDLDPTCFATPPAPTSANVGRSQRPHEGLRRWLPVHSYGSDPHGRLSDLIHQAEDMGALREQWQRFWLNDQPMHLTPERVHGGIQ